MAGIGDIVATLSIDNKAWSNGLKQAQTQQNVFVSSVKQSSQTLNQTLVQNFKSGFDNVQSKQSSFVGSIVKGFAPIAVGLAGAFGFKTTLGAFQESLTQSRKLNSVLAATGGAAGLTGQQISDYAAAPTVASSSKFVTR